MYKFLEIVYSNQIADGEKGDKFSEFFSSFFEKLKATVSEELYDQFEEIFTTFVVENNKYYAVEGMKLAIGIIDGSYIPF